jgi:hypothetical protein
LRLVGKLVDHRPGAAPFGDIYGYSIPSSPVDQQAQHIIR